MDDTLLCVENLQTYFYMSGGVAKAVDGISFSLRCGESLGIVGESGSGKSVTAYSLMRMLSSKNGRIESGRVIFEGRDLLTLPEKELRALRGNEVSMIFQDPMTSLDPVFQVGYQMIELLRTHHPHMSREDAKRVSIEALRGVGIPDPERRFHAYPYELSGGMCQRVIIAMALLSEAKLLIADEPTTALDVTVQAQILRLIQELQREKNTAVLLITHNLGLVWEMCRNVIVMYAGKVVEYAETKTLYQNPLHPYTWGLLDSIPSLHAEPKKSLPTIKGVPPDLRLCGKGCNFANRCPYATALCSEQVPPLVETADGHWVACHRQNGAECLTRDRR